MSDHDHGRLLRHSCATVDPNRERLPAPFDRFTQNHNQTICRKTRPVSLLSGWLRIPVAVLTNALLKRAGAPRLALAFAREPQSCRRPVGGRGEARAGSSRGRGLAASALRGLAGCGRHRLGRDLADRDCGCARDECRPGRTIGAISLWCASRWRGCRDAGEGGRATERLASCALFVRGVSSASTRMSSSSRSTG
jgi:hypothetical protein